MMRKDGAVPLLARLLQSDKAQLLVPIVGILNHFAKEVNHLYTNQTSPGQTPLGHKPP